MVVAFILSMNFGKMYDSFISLIFLLAKLRFTAQSHINNLTLQLMVKNGLVYFSAPF